MVITSAEARVWHLVGTPSTREQHNAGGNFYAQDGSLLTSVEGNGTCGQLSIRPLHVNGLSIPNFRWKIIIAAKLAGMAAIAEREAGFRSLKDTWADTTTPHGRLMVTVLGGLAEFERELIRARTGDGRARAKARGVKFGRPTALTPHQRAEALQRLGNGEAQADVARTFNVSQATISRLAAA